MLKKRVTRTILGLSDNRRQREIGVALGEGDRIIGVIQSVHAETGEVVMADVSSEFYASISSYRRIEKMIEDGDAEDLYLECKSPRDSHLGRGEKDHLARALSGFSNTSGGVLIYGVSTTNHDHGGIDVMTQIQPLGAIRKFEQQLTSAVPTLTTPPVLNVQTKVLRHRPHDTRGVVVAYIPKTMGDPVQVVKDSKFYFRSGDDFTVAPYEMVKRLFSATESPDLHPVFLSDHIKLEMDESFTVPIIVENRSSATAQHVVVFVEIENADKCQKISPKAFVDQSAANLGKKLFFLTVPGVIHRGLNMNVGNFNILMKQQKRALRRFDMTITLYANKMVARMVLYSITLAKSGCSFKKRSDAPLY